MPDALDMDLVREFARNHSEAAFTELVQRHLPLVYSVARRYTGNDGDAQDVAQAVFIILARKAAVLRGNTLVPGWLYETTRFTATRLLRTNLRRNAREQEAYMQSTLNEGDTGGDWEKLAPHLETAMARLGERDRALLVLRFYQNKTGAEAATLMGVRENTLHKRVARALNKLRTILAKQGVTLSGEAVAGAIASNSIQPIPAGLAKTISAAALAKGATASASTLTLVHGALKLMAWTKVQTAIAVGVGILLVAGTTTITVREIQAHTRYPWEIQNLNLGMLHQFPPQTVIVPTVFNRENWIADNFGHGGSIGICLSVTNIVQLADEQDIYRMVFATNLPTERYDYFVKLKKDHGYLWKSALLAELKSKLGVVEKKEVRNADVLLLEYKNPHASGLRPPGSLLRSMRLSSNMRGMIGTNFIAFFMSPISPSLQTALQSELQIPVIDRSGLTGNYDYKLTCDWSEQDPTRRKEKLKQTLYDQLGFELVPTNMPYEMLVVEKSE